MCSDVISREKKMEKDLYFFFYFAKKIETQVLFISQKKKIERPRFFFYSTQSSKKKKLRIGSVMLYHVLRMLNSRNYTNISSNASHVYCTDGKRRKTVVVYGCHESHLGVREINDILSQFKDIEHIIVITQGISHVASQLFCSNDKNEILSPEEISYMKTSHFLVPHYRIIKDDQELSDLESKYGTKDKFPKMIFRGDAIGRYLGFELSDVVEVSRSYHVDNMKTYRILVRE